MTDEATPWSPPNSPHTADGHSPELETFISGEVVGSYEVIALVGMGGLGAVYKVKKGGEVLALKVPWGKATRKASRQSATRLAREFHTLWCIHHPYIVRPFDFGWHEGSPFYTMELLEGLPLPEYINRARPRQRDVLQAFFGVTQAVAYLHGQGICHRDLTPSNIFVRRGGQPVLLDFGLCQPLLAPTITAPGELIGTVQYLSPEYATYLQVKAKERHVCTPAEDVYALGVVLYELLTGKLPYRLRTGRNKELFHAIRHQVPPHPTEVQPSAPLPLADLAMRLLAKKPSRRPQNGSELVALLLPALLEARPYLWGPAPGPSGTTLSSSQVTPRRSGWKWRRSLPVLFPLLLLLGWMLLAASWCARATG